MSKPPAPAPSERCAKCEARVAALEAALREIAAENDYALYIARAALEARDE